MPSTQYTAGEIPNKASTKTLPELQTEYGQRRQYHKRHIFSGESIYADVERTKQAISGAREPKYFIHTQNELFKLLEKDQSVDPDPSEVKEVNRLMTRAHYHQEIANDHDEQSIMNHQLELREGRRLGDATCMSILQLVSRSVSRDSAVPLCLTKARDYCTPSFQREV
jgi:hypothetical protein